MPSEFSSNFRNSRKAQDVSSITKELMKIIKFLAIIFALFLVGCQQKKEKFELTFFRWSIHEDYFLKINSSDTIYFVIDNPIENQTKYAVIGKEEKDKIENYISHLSFPKDEYYSNNVEDGLSYLFFYKDKFRQNKILIHAHAGPKEFWEFGKYLESIKNNAKFISTNKKVILKDIQNFMLLKAPPPPKVTATNSWQAKLLNFQ